MQRICHPLIALTALSLALNACQTTAPDRFDHADKNRDGTLSRDEINTHLVTAIFDSRDADHDQKMTKAEWIVGNDPGQEKQFRERDVNHDGVVTLDEALAYERKQGMASKFTREADKNKDGAVSRQELTDYYASKEGPPQ
jgi:Ca2+-binding EF-hand superfamily protein